jgi:type I restriction enzyme, S subunit
MLAIDRRYREYKDSGVPSIADVPAHWKVLRLRNVCTLLVSNVDKKTEPNEEAVRLCNYVDVYKNARITNRIKFMRATASQNEIERFRIKTGDVIITKDSETWDDIAVPAIANYEASDLVCGYHLAILRPRQELMRGSFLFRAIQSNPVSYQFHVSANGVTRYGLSQGAIKDVMIPVPSVDEQEAITRVIDYVEGLIQKYTGTATFVGKQTANLTLKTGGVVGRGIAVLVEYRTRLLADLVTGKVDVREAAQSLPPESAEFELPDENNDLSQDDLSTDEVEPEAAEEV